MKKMRQVFFFILITVLSGSFVNAQTNLLKNGNFKNGTEGWRMDSFELMSDNGYNYIATGNFIFPGRMPYVMTDNQEINIEPGETYIISFWASGVDASLAQGKCVFILSDGTREDYLEDVEGLDAWNKIYFDVVEQRENGWVKLQREITFPENIDVVSMVDFKITLSSSFVGNLYNKKISEISIAKKTSAPQGFTVAPEVFQQRYTKLNWVAEDGKFYKIDINGTTYQADEGANSLYIRGLLPNTLYTAELYSTDSPDDKAMLEFRTKDYIEANEENRIPFLGNITDGQIPRSFIYHIDDLSGDKIMNVDITYAGSSANINKDGVVSLPNGVNEGTLIVNITQEGGEKTVLKYKSITVQSEEEQ